MKIKIDFEKSTDLIELNPYSDIDQQMPIRLVLDWEAGEIYTKTHDYSQGIPALEWNGTRTALALPPHTDALRLKEWVKTTILSTVNKIEEGYTSRFDGSNLKGEFTEEAYSLLEDLKYWVYSMEGIPVLESGGLWNTDEWLSDVANEKVKPDSTDEELEKWAKDWEEEAEYENIVLTDDVYTLLSDIREMKQED
jgi:hypothetical protein